MVGTWLSIIVVSWWRWRRRTRSASGDLDVRNVQVAVVVALLLASSVTVQPRHGLANVSPVADSDGHASFKISNKAWVVAAALRVHSDGESVLRKLCGEVVIGVESRLGSEGLGGVELFTWAIRSLSVTSLDTLAITVTPVIEALVAWGIAFVWSRSPGISVCLHDVEFWAEVSSTIIGVTVVVVS